VAFSVSADPPDDSTRQQIRRLADRIEHEDGAPPLSDQALSHLGSADVDHVVVRDDAAVVGYAQVADHVLEVAADVDAVAATLDAVPAAARSVWTHGRRSRLVAGIESRGYLKTRELLQLRRPLDDEHPLPADRPLPDGVEIRAFEPGHDDDAWLALNAAAFAEHAEQGRWTHDDLAARMAEPWFDPQGFLLADRGGSLLGFHWTKIHPDGAGEVYVLGISPQAQGLGLGHTLLNRGLRLLADRGAPLVLLYVDGDNTNARGLYLRAGFFEHDLDVQWRRTAPDPAK
jgi:mycothiol synthase